MTSLVMHPIPRKILLHPSNTDANGRYRIKQPAEALEAAGRITPRIDFRYHDADTLKIARPDVVVFQTPYTDAGLAALRLYRKTLPASLIVYEIDDKLWDVPIENPAAASLPVDIKRRIKLGLRLAQRVIVSTEELGSVLSRDFKIPRSSIAVASNCVTEKFVNEATAGFGVKPERGGRRRVGWAGGLSHARDLELLLPLIEASRGDVDWVFLGSHPNADGIEFHEAVAWDDYARKLGSLKLDAAYAPLVDDGFNACKSDLRALEFAAAGIPVFTSLSPAFNQVPGTKGLIDPREPSDDFLATLAERQYDWVRGERLQSRDHNLDMWQRCWTPDGAEGFQPKVVEPDAEVLQVSGKDAITGFQYAFDHGIHAYVGPTAAPMQLQEVFAGNQIAAASGISNEGDYPVPQQFTPIPDADVDLLRSAVMLGNEGLVAPAVFPSGPSMLFNGMALRQFGIPDIRRFGSLRAAAIEWGARAFRGGWPSASVLSHLTVLSEATVCDAVRLQDDLRAAVFWHPELLSHAKTLAENPVFAQARRNIDLYLLRYRADPPDDERPEGYERILVINGSEEFLKGLIDQGKAIFSASVVSHLLTLDPRAAPNTEPLDLRADLSRLHDLVTDLAAGRVILHGLGQGNEAVLGALTALARSGIPVTYVPRDLECVCPRLICTLRDGSHCGDRWKEGVEACQACVDTSGSAAGYVRVGAYRATWGAFLEAAGTATEA